MTLATLACASADATRTDVISERRAAIVGGVPSDATHDAVVVVVRGAFREFCTGFIIAPGWVLTARHCLFGSTLDASFYEKCQTPSDSTRTFAWPPDDFTVLIGSEKPLSRQLPGLATYADAPLDFCVNDVALLQVEADENVESLPLRLDGPPLVDEGGVVIGWGYTANDEPLLPDRRQARTSRVLMLGRDYFDRTQRFVADAAFVMTEGACIGDDGAPMIADATGAVIGLLQGPLRLEDGLPDERARNCLDAVTLSQRVDARADWIRSTLRQHGAAPWIEGKQPPGAFGEGCVDGDECVSGVCVGLDAEPYCSEPCVDRLCPEGLECVGERDERVCVHPIRAHFDLAGGCMLSPASTSRFWPQGVWLAGLAVGLRRRRNVRYNATCSEEG